MAKIGQKVRKGKAEYRPGIVEVPFTDIANHNWSNHTESNGKPTYGGYAVQTTLNIFRRANTTIMKVKVKYDENYGLHRAEADYYCVVTAGTACVTFYPEGQGAPIEDHTFKTDDCFLIEKGALFNCRAILRPEPRQLPNPETDLEMVWFFKEES